MKSMIWLAVLGFLSCASAFAQVETPPARDQQANDCPVARSGNGPLSINYDGTLASSDNTLDESEGEYYDACPIRLNQGEWVVIDLTADAFDTYLFVQSPSGEFMQNNDHEGSPRRSRIELSATEAGDWLIGVTSRYAKETGAYRVSVTATAQDDEAAFITRTGSLAAIISEMMAREDGNSYVINVTAGQRVIADLTSSEFDPYLILIDPSGNKTRNDDYEGASNRSRIELTASESGEWEVIVTSSKAGDAGSYTLQINRPIANIMGSLDDDDDQLSSGEYADVYTVDLAAGEDIEISVVSFYIEPFVILIDPNGEQTQNYAYRDITSHAAIELTAGVTGAWTIIVTSVKPGETGKYLLSTTPSTREGGRVGSAMSPSGGAGSSALQGTLSSSDRTLNDGEYYDAYYISVSEGDRIQATLTSNDFDTYLVAVSSSGDRQENDDIGGSENRSELDFRAAEDGQWRIMATSYDGGERGAYNLELTPSPAASPVAEQAFYGTLQAGDRTLDSGEYYDVYYFQAEAGQTITVKMTSLDFDTYLVVADPGGDMTENDDFRDSKNRSRVDLTAQETGEWRVTVTSYKPGETGVYGLELVVE